MINWSERTLYRRTALYQWRLLSKKFRALVYLLLETFGEPGCRLLAKILGKEKR